MLDHAQSSTAAGNNSSEGNALNSPERYKLRGDQVMSTTATKKVTNSEDVIDLREVTDRVEYLEEQPTLDDDGACYSCGSRDLKEGDESHESDCEVLELQRLNAL